MKPNPAKKFAPYAIVGAAVAVGAIVKAQTNAPKTNSAPVVKNTKIEPAIQVAEASTARKPLEHYTGGVRANLFAAPAAKAPEPVVKKVDPLPQVPDVVPTPEVIDPFVDYSYSGTMFSGNEVMGLIENSKTREGQFLKVGDQFMGGKVTAIDERSIALSVAGKEKRLAKLDDYKLVPLDKSAPFLEQQGGRGMGMPGMPVGFPGFPGGGTMGGGMGNLPPEIQQRIQERMQQFGGGANAAQMQNRMDNRSFEGGRGGRGGRGGGGGFGGGGFGGGGFGGGGFGGGGFGRGGGGNNFFTRMRGGGGF